ncbi:fatty acid synthase alpha subunit Lsd1 [Coemansia aciculifera]|nr:fatty acid synthase alpha subunit Lsd1 [Coemansia aciculifera]
MDLCSVELEKLAKHQATELLLLLGGSDRGVGVDIEAIADINIENPTFVERNFTAAEQAYCWSRPNPHASFAGKWCAKEAAVKAVSSIVSTDQVVWTKGSAAPLVDIEICVGASAAPQVVFHGEAKEAVERAGISLVRVSISHIDLYAIATAIALKEEE